MTSDPWATLRRFTAARIALGRVGDGLPTKRVLEFELAHARARDAVNTPLAVDRLAADLKAFAPVVVASEARTRAEYLQRPDRGRSLEAAARARLARGRFDAALVVADGLSARAVQDNAPPLVARLHELLPKLKWAPVTIVVNGRVAVGDDAAAALGAALVVVLIGERPGLSAPDSLGAYLTFDPKPGVTRDSGRNCVSNIRPGGLAVADAATRIAALMTMARRIGISGVALKEDDALALFARRGEPGIAKP
jgi:ethanolamine ammonia-lyase small subunit